MKSVLDPIIHDRLIKGIDKYAEDANIPVSMIQFSSATYCTDGEGLWLRKYKFIPPDENGLILVGAGDPTMEMMAMAGMLTRNFIRARFYTLQQLLDSDADEDLFDITCLFIANFYNHTAHADVIQNWKLPAIYDILIRRAARGKKTVVQVSDIEKMRKVYGAAISNHIQATYAALEMKGN
ncbi:hypothetical protein EVB27_018 [Rhizobium phage RHph_TM16]|nr:hypothetical protein EVB27_018 [Rhizobium phage RHph_TM16]